MIQQERKCDECQKIIPDDAGVLRVKAGITRAKNTRTASGDLETVPEPPGHDDAELCSDGCAVTRFRRAVLGQNLTQAKASNGPPVTDGTTGANLPKASDVLEVRG